MPPRSSVRTNIVIFTILGFVVALLILPFVIAYGTTDPWRPNRYRDASSCPGPGPGSGRGMSSVGPSSTRKRPASLGNVG